jgi:hypothetical protein
MLPTDRQIRETYILDAVRSGRALIQWAPLVIEGDGHRLVLQVTSDAVRVDGVRVAVTPKVQQAMADALGVLPLTALVVDRIHQAAAPNVRAQPSGGWSGSQFQNQITYSTAQMVEHSARVDRAIARAGATGPLYSSVGKDWILSNKAIPPVAANYGWLDQAAPYKSVTGLPIWQQTGTRHNTDHGDYSQVARFMRREATLDGQAVDLRDVLRGPLAKLVSHEGPLARLSLTGAGGSTMPPAPATPAKPTTPATPRPTPGPALGVARDEPSAGGVVLLGGFLAVLVAWFKRKR